MLHEADAERAIRSCEGRANRGTAQDIARVRVIRRPPRRSAPCVFVDEGVGHAHAGVRACVEDARIAA